MKRVEQTILAPPHGNCTGACIASVLELSIEEVPQITGEDWRERWNEWLAPRNLSILTIDVEACNGWRPPGYALLAVDSPRGPWLHNVVAFDGEIVWDPHPLRSMGVGARRWWDVLLVLDPSKAAGSPPPGKMIEADALCGKEVSPMAADATKDVAPPRSGEARR